MSWLKYTVGLATLISAVAHAVKAEPTSLKCNGWQSEYEDGQLVDQYGFSIRILLEDDGSFYARYSNAERGFYGSVIKTDRTYELTMVDTNLSTIFYLFIDRETGSASQKTFIDAIHFILTLKGTSQCSLDDAIPKF